MTRSLYILRHGKSDWGAAYGSDHDRPLKKRGHAAAERMGRFLTRNEQAPQTILSSSALRAQRTAEIASDAGGWNCPLHVDNTLYGATTAAVLASVAEVAAEVERLLVVGHEPTSSLLVGELTGSLPPRFPTAALARIDFDAADWERIGARSGTLVFLIPPRLLPDED